MTNQQFRRSTAATALPLGLAILLAGTPATAQVADTAAGFRYQIERFSAEMEQATQMMLQQESTSAHGSGNRFQLQLIKAARNNFLRAKEIMPQASEADIERMRQVFSDNPGLLDLPDTWMEKMQEPKTKGPQRIEHHEPTRSDQDFCNGGQFDTDSGGADSVNVNLSGITGLVNSLLDLFDNQKKCDEDDNECFNPDDEGGDLAGFIPGDVQVYDAGLKGQYDCERVSIIADAIGSTIPDTIGSVGVGFIVSGEIDIPNPIKIAWEILTTANDTQCNRMALANELNTTCTIEENFHFLRGGDPNGGGLALTLRDIDSQITTHDTNISNSLSAHDANITTQIGVHDTNISTQIFGHDLDIKALLALLQGGVDNANRQLEVSLASQRQIMALLLTPQGARQLDELIISCDQDSIQCPDVLMACVADPTSCGWNDLP